MRLEDILRRLRLKAAERRDKVVTAMSKGVCGDYGAYKEQVGECKGLLTLDDFIKEVLVELNAEDDE